MAGNIDQTTLVTLKGLNQVYTAVEGDISGVVEDLSETKQEIEQELTEVQGDLQEQINTLKAIYVIKGAVTWSELLALRSANEGEVYILTDDSPYDPKAGDNMLCIQSFNSPISPSDWEAYWNSIGGLSNIASATSAGVLKVDTPSLDSESTNSITRHLSIDPVTDAGYTTIPVATDNVYGVVSTIEQTFAGKKNFGSDVDITGDISINGDAEVAGGISVVGDADFTGSTAVGGNTVVSGVATFNNSVAFYGNVSFEDNANLTTVNAFTVRELIIGSTRITSENGVISFNM